MADIFISYSKADRELVDKLATVLEAEGWTVWWDDSLAAGDTFRDEIMKELTAARAVIAIWSKTSIDSDWVRAEAGRAKADGKLIPVKTPELGYPDIPLPFGEMHTENVTAHELIRAAVIAQLAKPQMTPSTFWMATKTVRLQALTWIGIIGGAVTIFANLRGLLTLADWASWLVTRWQDWTQAFWTVALGWIGIRISPVVVPFASFALFVVMVAIGAYLRSSPSRTAQVQGSRRPWMSLLKWIAAYVLYIVIVYAAFAFGVPYANVPGVIEVPSLILLAFAVPAVAIVWISKDRLQAVLLVALLAAFWAILAVAPWFASTGASASGLVPDDVVERDPVGLLISVILLYVSIPLCAVALVIVSPVRLVNQRLLFLLFGAIVLIVLNQISALGLHQFLDAPKS